MDQKPIYRDDAKGNLRGIKEDCTQAFRAELARTDTFVFGFEDCTETFAEYAVYLTLAELRACYKKAQSAPSCAS